MRWFRRRKHSVPTAEARELAERVKARDAEVARLGEDLSEIAKRNHFSELVFLALSRTRQEARRGA